MSIANCSLVFYIINISFSYQQFRGPYTSRRRLVYQNMSSRSFLLCSTHVCTAGRQASSLFLILFLVVLTLTGKLVSVQTFIAILKGYTRKDLFRIISFHNKLYFFVAVSYLFSSLSHLFSMHLYQEYFCSRVDTF